MTDRKYLRIMVALGEELERVCSFYPGDSAAQKDIIDEIKRTNRIWTRSRHRFSCWTRWILFILSLLLAGIVYQILF